MVNVERLKVHYFPEELLTIARRIEQKIPTGT
jgi:hypothetical protein